MIKNLFFAAFLAIFAVAGLSSQASAAAPIYTGTFGSTAVSGYDTVSYFKGSGVPVKGSKEFKTEWRGAKWLFSSQENLDTFKANPEKYAPQYGGYCAWATAQGKLVKGDPKQYTLDNGKLYLNYDAKVKKKWLPNKAEFISQADAKYPTLVDLK